MPNPQSPSQGRVLLAEQRAASAVLHAVLADAVAAFPGALGGVGLPNDPKAFRGGYAEVLPRFEAARLASGERCNVARHVVAALRQHLIWQDGQGSRPLHEALMEAADPLPLQEHMFGGEPAWQPTLVYRGARWGATQLAELGAVLVERGCATPSVGEALAWIGERALGARGLNLAGRKIAVLGGGAEMAPTRFWLEAGADVLWLDVVPPPESWLQGSELAGRLYWPVDNVDLLSQPRQVLATLIDFADGDALDIGLYAYAPGQARELLLTGAMNALVDALPRELLASVTMLVSPTTPTALSRQDLDTMQTRLEARPLWEAALLRLGLLGRGSAAVTIADAAVTRTVVAIQGASYQAAQYLGKVLAAECWSAGDASAADPVRISANTAAITRTRSLDHPVFAAAFGGAGAFGVETLVPRLSRRLNGLLAVHDWLHPESPVPGSVRVHGGIHTLPYPLDPALRVAAAIGFARSPRLLRGLIRK
jgi:hypothetical protein